MDQQQIIQIQLIEQEVNQLNEQLQLIEQHIKEMNDLNESLDEIGKSKEKTEILANLGKKIYIPVEVKDKGKDLKLTVEIGKGNYVKKSVSATRELVDKQIVKLEQGKGQIMSKLEELQKEMERLMRVIEQQKKQVLI